MENVQGKILKEIVDERIRQDEIWGGKEHDDGHRVNDWVAIITEYLGRSREEPHNIKNFRNNMVRVAALAVAAVESVDRAVGKSAAITELANR